MRRLLFLVPALMLLGVSWNGPYEADPDDSDLAADIDNFIRSVKLETRNRASVEANWGAFVGDDNGLLRLGSGRCFMQNAAPTVMNPGQYNASSGGFGPTGLTDEEIGASIIDQGTGRCWIDLDGLDNVAATADDNQLNIWIDTGVPATSGWTAVRARKLPATQTVVTSDSDIVAVALPNAAAGAGNPFLTATATGVTGSIHEVTGTVSVQITDLQSEPVGFVQLTEECAPNPEATVFQAVCGYVVTSASPTQADCTVPLHYINAAPVAGNLCTYRVRAWWDPLNATAGTYTPVVAAVQTTSRLYVKQEPVE